MNTTLRPIQLGIELIDTLEHLKAGRTSDAEASCQRLIEALPDQGKLLNRIGCEAYQAGRLSDAEDLLRLAVAHHPREPQIYQNLAVVLDAQGQSQEATAIRDYTTKPPFFSVSAGVITDLGAWGRASGYETRAIAQQGFTVDAIPNNFPESVRLLARRMSIESGNDAWAVCAEDMRLVYWRWKDAGISDEVMIPMSRADDIIYDPFWLKRYPFINTWATDDSRCTIHLTPFAPTRLKVEQECFFLGGHLTYGHWLADYLPKLQALKAAGLPDNLPIIMTQMTNWQRDILACLGLMDRVIELTAASESRCTIVEFDRVWLADGFSMRTRYDFLRKTFAHLPSRTKLEVGNARPLRIYIARLPNSQPDRVVNAEDVRNYAEKRGFVVVFGEKLSIQEKVELFRNAEIIVTEPGSGEFNYYAFAQEKCILVQLMASTLFETPSDVTLKAAFSYVVPFLDKVIYAIGTPLVPIDPSGLTTFPAIYSIEVMKEALDKAELLIAKANRTNSL